jgi:hypothetical protein
VRRLLLFTIAFSSLVGPIVAESPKVTPEPKVTAILALKSEREHREHLIPWHDSLTVDAAIRAATRKPQHAWKEAWRYRESFWTRTFRNPHSFWAKLFAGEKATGFSYYKSTQVPARAAAVQPGDKIYVDLAPVF